MELDLTAVKTAFAQFSGEAADETGTQREALCAALCGQCARQVASLVRGDLSQAAQALWEAPLEELAAAQAKISTARQALEWVLEELEAGQGG